ncbi:topisomerase II associated protein [Cordyceps fumosorosea ARSEF 2679]|uniref:Topisomerase II associated protein n=1 Tax=Cordyceps fumosorosea (strain ARSEF 2679) TaxID=1081104 RepID=A0A168B2U8_CORFA|nr:topisomerase II associated protein [Cordyceps fumosorosea ARSEF 2679]OAA69541.1 topisomerase II associated protein [Cordyceps fumosorosea ARSEF 2679]
MSFFGFDTSGHNPAAPGFSQTHDPFAGLSGGNAGTDEALDFEDTYDGLGDQLDDADDAFNDDTFGGDGSGDVATTSKVGKDFDFFGQTAKVADAIEEEHLRFNRQQPATKSNAPQGYVAHSHADPYHASQQQQLHQQQQQQQQHQQQQHQQQHQQQQQQQQQQQYRQAPARTGYEKYHAAEPIPDLHVDQSIWGIGTSKAAAAPEAQSKSRKIMSLEEVEAAMRSEPKPAAPAQSPAPTQPQANAGYYPGHQQPTAQQPQYQQHVPHHQGPPVTILQRPQSGQEPHQRQILTEDQFLRQHAHPTQILQNPSRVSGDAQRTAFAGQQHGRTPSGASPMHQLYNHPQLSGMSEEEKAAFLDQETKRAKRNHKIWLLSKDNGVMTPQDKNFITRIQLQQLISATGNPTEQTGDASIAEDFYYQVYSHIRAGQRQNPSQPLSNFAQTYLFQTGSRHGARRHGRPAENHIQRMEQQVQRAVEAAKNKPKNPQLVIAGSLGKISFSNAKTPKPLLNIQRKETESPRPSTARTANTGPDRKDILRNVERVYDTLMKLEDHVRVIPPPMAGPGDPELEEKHRVWATELEALNAKLWNVLKVHEPIGATATHPFIAFLSCAKGKKAIPRIFPHLNFEQRTTILTMIVYHLDQLDVVRGAAVTDDDTTLNSRMRENIELFLSTVMPSLMQYFNDTGLDIVDGVLNLIATKQDLDLIARTRIGISMLTLILSRTVLLKQTGAGSTEQWEKWEQTFNILFSRLEPSLPFMFPGSVNAGVDVYVWQFLAAMGVSANHDQQTRLVLAVKDRVLDTVSLSKTLPPAMATERLASVNLFMRAIGLDVELLQ